MFKKRLLILVIPVVLAGWAAHAQEGVRATSVVQAAAPAELKSPSEFKAFVSKMLAGPDQKVEVIIEKHHGTFEKKGGQMIMTGDGGQQPQVMTLVEAQEMLSEIDLTGCKSNLKNFATASEMYAADNAGQYPPDLAKLAPNYLKVIMVCPAADSVTYSYSVSHAPHAYTIVCQGNHHEKAGVSPNFPQYNSYKGPAAGRDETPEPAPKP